MEKEFYVKLKIKDVELTSLDLEKIIYAGLVEYINRGLDFPNEDIEVESYDLKKHD